MNKTELKSFAVSSRRYLLEKVALRAKIFGIDENNGLIIEDKFGQIAINGETYSNDKKSAFLSLKKQLETKGYEQLIEEAAYTWFNRIIAIRYMEVNDYLPERVNVLSSSTGKVEPDILWQFETMDLNIDTVKIKDLNRQGETEEAYRQLFIAQCNALNKILPFMFEQIQDYTELLLPDYLLDSESVIKKLISNEALTESFTEVEVIGWLYQFYNSEPKDMVFANLKKNKKIEKYDIPAATQLFTPKWIVQYMVENSLGQLWLESNPDSSIKESMQYYIEPADQEEEVKDRLEEIRYKSVNLEEITIIDPCVGSGHILVYAFDLLFQMYEEAGYPSGEIPQLILEKNLYGLDIDDRAAQLASFALMMKGREKSHRIFRKNVELNIIAIQESNQFNKEGIAQLLGNTEDEKNDIRMIIDTFINAKNFGSILQPSKLEFDRYINTIEELGEAQLSVDTFQAYEQLSNFKNLLIQGKLLSSRYDISITNPPYMGVNGMNLPLKKYINENYGASKGDLSTAFMERCLSLSSDKGFITMINIPSWMFLSSYNPLRALILAQTTIQSLVHLGRGIFGSDFGTVSFVLRNTYLQNYLGIYKRLFDKQGAVDSIEKKEMKFFETNRDYYINQNKFHLVPGSSFSYWLSENMFEIFKQNSLQEFAESKKGLDTADNARFLRMWYEVNDYKVSFSYNSSSLNEKKWFPLNKGGSFRKWFGNNLEVINWEENGHELKDFPRSNIRNEKFYFKENITWTVVSSSKTGFRYSPKGFIFSNSGNAFFSDSNTNIIYLMGLLNSIVGSELLKILSPSIGYESGYIAKVPVVWDNQEDIINYIRENISISIDDWNAFEISWEYMKHPFLLFNNKSNLLTDAFSLWEGLSKDRFRMVKENEEKLNIFFIELYNLHDELTFEVPDKEITIRKGERVRDTKSFLSYFIGCAVGRYSLNDEGLVFAGGKWDDSKYKKFIPNKFGLIQLTDEHYFEDDIITRLREFLSVTFGVETVEENLQWLAESLELKRNETAEDRLRRYFLDEFFKDHCQVYQKCPIYWLIDSGKEKGLRTLIYMHRYQPDTMATIRFEQLQEIQAKYNNEIAAVDLRIVNPNLNATEKRDLEKRKLAYQKRLEELIEFDKNLAEYANAQIAIDLDDGVKVNYAKFDKVLAKIK
ncbi:BREX-1 system adenine-specific DNA-methyltransferase PglX [Neobacillus drentensis]|uniref:BREX-1 system adenine-specific DNA-methyltransferase PglX n=1 Tax=Neobacillus drentensis TaxID=220684 RepID=UPI00300015D5